MTLKYLKSILNSFVVLLSALILASCYGEDSGAPNRFNQANIPAVEAVKAQYGSLPLSERLSGTVIARNQVILYPEISGRISQVHVQNGSKVKEGDPLVSLRDNQYREQVEQAKATVRINQAQLKQAQTAYEELAARYNRIKKLNEKGLTSKQEMQTIQAEISSAEADVDLAKAQLDQAQSNLQEQQDLLSKTTIYAPISGTVGQRNAEVGMQVNTSTQLFTIGDLENLRIEVMLTDNMLDEIEIGQTAHVHVGSSEGNREIIEGKLARVSPFLNNVTRSTEGEIDVKNKNNRLRPGMFVPVDILYGESEQATLIPTSALYTNPNTGERGVFVATALGSEIEPAEQVDPENPPPLSEATDVEFQSVEVIAEGRMEVGVAGLDPGSWVVTVGHDLLAEGRNQARVRASSWERILALQGMLRQDLLQRILDRQQDAPNNSL